MASSMKELLDEHSALKSEAGELRTRVYAAEARAEAAEKALAEAREERERLRAHVSDLLGLIDDGMDVYEDGDSGSVLGKCVSNSTEEVMAARAALAGKPEEVVEP